MTANLPIDDALAEIAKEYRPGLLAWLKSQPDRWSRLLQLEDAINQTTLTGEGAGLRAALAAFKTFIKEMVAAYGEVQGLPLFGAKR